MISGARHGIVEKIRFSLLKFLNRTIVTAITHYTPHGISEHSDEGFRREKRIVRRGRETSREFRSRGRLLIVSRRYGLKLFRFSRRPLRTVQKLSTFIVERFYRNQTVPIRCV